MKVRTIATLYTWGSGALTMMGLDYWIDGRYITGPLQLLAAGLLVIAAIRRKREEIEDHPWPVNVKSEGMLEAEGIITKSHKEIVDGQEATVVDEFELTGISFVEKGKGCGVITGIRYPSKMATED